MKKIVFLCMFACWFEFSVSAQEWIVPENRRSRLSPFEFTDQSRKAGENSYNTNCLSCHGNPGKNNMIVLEPSPPDMVSQQAQRNTDGELYYKIAEGRGQMPTFKNVMPSNEIWNIIAYVRSFNRNYRQSVMPLITSSAYPGAEIIMSLKHDENENTVYVTASAVKEESSVPVTDAGVKLFISRTFGQLAVGDEVATDKSGVAGIKIPDDTPGDTAGNIRINVRFADEEAFGPAGKDTTIRAGLPTTPLSLVAQRAMWNKASMAPLWIIISFIGGLGTVWLFIFVIMLNIRDIAIVGKTIEREEQAILKDNN